MKILSNSARLGLWVLFCGALGSCSSIDRLLRFDFIDYPDSRVENLERLHTDSGRHHYSVRFVGDFEYAFNNSGRSIGGLHIGAPASQTAAGPARDLPDPSAACLKLLTELLEFDSSSHLRLEATQITWCARIIEEDPSVLSRERAALGLGALGRRVNVAGPLILPVDAPRASARETAQVLTDTVKAWGAWLDGQATRESWQTQAAVLRKTPFDLAGARRVLPLVAGLLRGLDKDSIYRAELVPLVRMFERHTIQLALGQALQEPSGPASVVRAAVVKSTVEAAGNVGLARLMPLLAAERQALADGDSLVKRAIMEAIAVQGLPLTFEGIEQEEFDRIRDNWVGLLVGIAVEDKQGSVRIKAMQALSQLVPELDSLREEDWEAWFYADQEGKRAANGQAPTPFASETLPGQEDDK